MKVTANLVDILQQKIYPAQITIRNQKITSIKRVSKAKNYILPGFIDSHIHIESSMLPPSSFAILALKHGTIATISDPHEIANVLGLKGVYYMLENANKTPLKIYFGASPCVPATRFETSGAKLGVKEIEELLKRDDILYLSEVMNFPGVIANEKEIMQKIAIAKKYKKHIDGHCPGLRGENLSKYISAGIETDHESFTLEEAEEKIKKGLKIEIREGSAAKNYEALHPLIAKYPDKLMFCSDDRHPDDLEKEHINSLVKRSLKKGYDLFDVLKIACINPIIHYGLDVGMLRVGDKADFIIVDNLENFEVQKTIIDGKIAYSKEEKESFSVPEIINNFHTSPKKEEDFEIEKCEEYLVIKAIDKQLITEKRYFKGEVPNIKNDILLFSVVNRYQNAKPALGLIEGFGLKKGAIASSVAHDSHNIVAVGCDKKSLSIVINEIIKHKGGICVYDGKKTDILELDIAGLMSSKEPHFVAKKYAKLQQKAKNLGSSLTSPFMTLSFMALLVIPKLKLSDKGLFDSEKFEFTKICKSQKGF
ncbi:adenine deaminase [Caminibacter pacificus]